MSLLPKETIKVIAEMNGFNLSDEIAQALAPDVEYRIREIIQEALKFMRHSHRYVMTTEDVNNALAVRNVEQLYGYSSRDELTFRRAPGNSDICYIEDKELEFLDLINAPLPKVLLDTPSCPPASPRACTHSHASWSACPPAHPHGCARAHARLLAPPCRHMYRQSALRDNLPCTWKALGTCLHTFLLTRL